MQIKRKIARIAGFAAEALAIYLLLLVVFTLLLADAAAGGSPRQQTRDASWRSRRNIYRQAQDSL